MNRQPVSKQSPFFSDLILMSTLTWIAEKELGREIKKQRRRISLEERHENFIAAVRI